MSAILFLGHSHRLPMPSNLVLKSYHSLRPQKRIERPERTAPMGLQIVEIMSIIPMRVQILEILLEIRTQTREVHRLAEERQTPTIRAPRATQGAPTIIRATRTTLEATPITKAIRIVLAIQIKLAMPTIRVTLMTLLAPTTRATLTTQTLAEKVQIQRIQETLAKPNQTSTIPAPRTTQMPAEKTQPQITQAILPETIPIPTTPRMMDRPRAQTMAPPLKTQLRKIQTLLKANLQAKTLETLAMLVTLAMSTLIPHRSVTYQSGHETTEVK